MHTHINSPFNPTDSNCSNLHLSDLVCTEKARQDIKNFTTELTGRERQLIVLMTRETVLCNRACERLLAKINLESLIKRGYLMVKSQVSANDDIQMNQTTPVAQNSSTVNNDINPVLNLVAGNF